MMKNCGFLGILTIFLWPFPITRVWFHVWNVHAMHILLSHQPAASKIAKHAQQIHSPINQQHQAKIAADQNVRQAFIHRLDWLHAHHAH